MKPIFLALKRVRLLSDMAEMDSPPMRTSPSSNSSRPERQFRSVVLPHPEGPMTATISPREMARSTPLNARTRTPPAAYAFSTPRASTIAVPALSTCVTLSFALPIKICSFVDAQVVGAARDGYVVAVGGAVVVPAPQVQRTAGGADVLVVELQVRGAAFHAEPRGNACGAADGYVAGTAENDHGHGARGGGERHLQAADATMKAERSEPEPAEVGD